MNRRKLLTPTLTMLLLLGLVPAGVADISNSAVLFLRLPASARAAGMGDAFVAVADDAAATHYNPAGLGAAPLADTWTEYQPPFGFRPIEKMAVLRKSKGSGSEAYDLWVLSENGLVRFDGNQWNTSEVFDTRTDQTARGIISSYFKITDDSRLDQIIMSVAKMNFGLSYDEIQKMHDLVLNNLPEGFEKVEAITVEFDSLLVNFMQCRLDRGRLQRLKAETEKAFSDSVLSLDELNRLDIMAERSRTRFLPEELIVPYAALFTGNITTISSNGDILMVGTSEGLMHFSGRRWRMFTEADGLPSNAITHLYPVGANVLVATDSGLTLFNGSSLDTLKSEFPLPEGPIEALGASGLNDIYVVINHDLYHYDGSGWSNTFEYTVQTETTAEEIADRFSIYGSSVERKYYVEKLRSLTSETALAGVKLPVGNGHTNASTIFEPGSSVSVPYTAGLKSKVNAIFARPGGELLLGTEHGVFRFTGNEWRTPGYSKVIIVEGQTLDDFVARRKFGSPEEGQAYAAQLRLLNDLETTGLQPGSSIKIYRNPAAAPVQDIAYHDQTILIASDAGLLEFDGYEWKRADTRELGRQPTVEIVSLTDQTWFVTTDKIVTRTKGRLQISAMGVKWLPQLADDLFYEYLTPVIPISDFGTIGFSFPFISFGSINRTGAQGQNLGTFESYDIAVSVSYGTSLSRKLKGGISAKVINSKLADQGAGLEKGKGTSVGFAFDFGLLYHWTPRLNLGMAFTNLGPKLAYIDAAQADDLPRNLAIGFAYKLLKSEYNQLLITAEANKIMVGVDDGFSQEIKEVIWNSGIEFQYAKLFAARAGYMYDQEGRIKAITVGAGLWLSDIIRFDFAYIPSQKNLALGNTLLSSILIQL